MHPYEMQRLVRQRHKEDFLDLKRGSLYHAIDRLVRDGFIEEESTEREGRRPERTNYRLTEAGDRELQDWLSLLLARPAREASPFVAALSFLGHLSPQEVLDHLDIRARDLECRLVAHRAVMENLIPKIGRLPLIEAEYVVALRQAELDWVRRLIDEIKSGQFTWDPAWWQRGNICGEEKPST
jgi:DNA-binding PadR family transcriptional regulator